MSFARDTLRAEVAHRGPVLRVVVAEVRGSAPREPGAAMLVWPDRVEGTIGGGTLEHRAIAAARAGHRGPSRHALGPDLGQCCGGAVTLHTAEWDVARLDAVPPEGPAAVGTGPRPTAVTRMLAGSPSLRAPRLVEGWLVEPVATAPRAIWIWGAGHVGRALTSVLAPLPGMTLTWVDVAPERFPETLPPHVTRLVAADMPRAVRHAPDGVEHLIATFSHEIDLALCHALLGSPSSAIGLIGSATKWARFQSRLRQLGHRDADITRIACPIGDPGLGKHPQAIAVGVAAALLTGEAKREREAG